MRVTYSQSQWMGYTGYDTNRPHSRNGKGKGKGGWNMHYQYQPQYYSNGYHNHNQSKQKQNYKTFGPCAMGLLFIEV